MTEKKFLPLSNYGMKIAKEIKAHRQKFNELKDLQLSLLQEVSLRIAKEIRKGVHLHIAPDPSKLKKEEMKAKLKKIFKILYEAFEVFPRFRLEFVENEKEMKGNDYDAHIDREKRIFYVHLCHFNCAAWNIISISVHEFVHFRFVEPFAPIEAFYIWLMERLYTFVEENPTKWPALKSILDEALKKLKDAIEQNYDMAEVVVNLLVKKLSPLSIIFKGIDEISDEVIEKVMTTEFERLEEKAV